LLPSSSSLLSLSLLPPWENPGCEDLSVPGESPGQVGSDGVGKKEIEKQNQRERQRDRELQRYKQRGRIERWIQREREREREREDEVRE
jgi:hypothetical protein